MQTEESELQQPSHISETANEIDEPIGTSQLNKAPPEALAVMHRATDDLRASGIMDRAIGVGDPAPAFELADSTGATVSLAGLLAQGPLVLTWFRGHW